MVSDRITLCNPLVKMASVGEGGHSVKRVERNLGTYVVSFVCGVTSGVIKHRALLTERFDS